ncbi:MAG: GNAT family N-acetyltransferase [Candidatus Diapherotrites archaeon]|uniref:GNAT family N-acetyltransferase n=1 Tax=Candidatus Iainarchaeum sp. TaxID=3101447 RepID=A0A8T4C621_9ARCH|nr:GNAT family N-acetyltransferase [Candidatus Diapherotrites archaeon]
MSESTTPALKHVLPLRYAVWDRSDTSLYHDLNSLWRLQYPKSVLSQKRFAELAAIGYGFLLVYRGKKPVGYVWYSYFPRSRNREYLTTLEYFVRKEERGKDIPKKMIEQIFLLARQKGMPLIHLLHNNPRMVQHIEEIVARNRALKARTGVSSAVQVRLSSQKPTSPFRDAFVRIKPTKRFMKK